MSAHSLTPLNFFHFDQQIIKMSQPRFSCAFILALVLNGFSIVLRLESNETILACMGRQWLFHLSFNLAFGTLMVKVYRVFRLLSFGFGGRRRGAPSLRAHSLRATVNSKQ